jgi:hypothetical protein
MQHDAPVSSRRLTDSPAIVTVTAGHSDGA